MEECCQESRIAPLNEHHRLQVRYSGGRPVVIRGPVTGSSYRFSGTERVRLIHPRDAAALLRSRMFRVEGVVEQQCTEAGVI